jgi:hypothetical protein
LKGKVLELGELKGWGGGRRGLDRVFKREKREASVRRKKRERCLPVPVHGLGERCEKAVWRRAETQRVR